VWHLGRIKEENAKSGWAEKDREFGNDKVKEQSEIGGGYRLLVTSSGDRKKNRRNRLEGVGDSKGRR